MLHLPFIHYKHTEQKQTRYPYDDQFVSVLYFTDVDRGDIKAQEPEIQELVQAGKHFGVI